MRALLLPVACSLLSGCVATTAVHVATLPVRATAWTVDRLTVSQAEADRNLGRRTRKQAARDRRERKREEREARRDAQTAQR